MCMKKCANDYAADAMWQNEKSQYDLVRHTG